MAFNGKTGQNNHQSYYIVSTTPSGDITSWGAATAQGCPQGLICAGRAVLCVVPCEVVRGSWQHWGDWAHCSRLTVVGQGELWLALGGPLLCPCRGQSAAVESLEGSAWRRSSAVADHEDG